MTDVDASPLEARADLLAGLGRAPAHKRAVFENAERMANERDTWIEKNAAYYRDDRRYLRFIIPEGARVLDLGCGTGSLLSALKPSRGVGVDFSPAMIAKAKAAYPNLEFVLGDIEDPRALASIEGEFDFIVLSDTIGSLEDIEETLRGLHPLCSAATRIVIAYFSPLWEPLINLASKVGLRMPQPQVNLISSIDFLNIMDLTEFDADPDGDAPACAVQAPGDRSTYQSLHCAFARDPKAVFAHLPRDPIAKGAKTRGSIDHNSDPLPQRARQHRAGDQGDAAVRRPPGNHICRGKFERRHLRGMSESEKGFCRRLGYQSSATGRQGQEGRGS